MYAPCGYSVSPSQDALRHLLYADGLGCIANDPFFNIRRTHHPDYLIMHCLNGTLWIDEDGKKTPLTAGDSCLMDLTRPHYYYTTPEAPCELLWIDFNGGPVRQLEAALFFQQRFLLYQSAHTADWIVQCIDLYKKREQNWELALSGILYTILMEAFAALQHQQGFNTEATHYFIRTLDDYIDQHMHSKITLDDLSRLFHLDASYLCRKTKALCGMSPMEYVTNKKILVAKHRLLYSYDSLKTISDHLGFCDQNHFSYVFFKHVGLYPSAFRKQNKAFSPGRE